MKLSLAFGISVAVIAWIVLYLILGVPLWIAFLVGGVIIAVLLAGAAGRRTAAS